MWYSSTPHELCGVKNPDIGWSFLSEDNNMRLRCLLHTWVNMIFSEGYFYHFLRYIAVLYRRIKQSGSRAFGQYGLKWARTQIVKINFCAANLSTASPNRCGAIKLIIAGRMIRRTSITVSFANVRTQRVNRSKHFEKRCDSMFYFASTTTYISLSLSFSFST